MAVIRIYDLITHIMQIIFFCLLLLQNIGSTREDDFFCSCDEKKIKCKNIEEDPDILALHFSLAKQDCITANKLRISKSKLPALPHNLLNGSDFSEIKITESSLPFLAVPVGKENPFIGGSAIKKFTLESVRYAYNWDWSILNACGNLTDLHISKSDMIYVGPAFNMLTLPYLVSLTIKKSGVRWIHSRAFSSLRSLAFLNLMDNEITELERSLLPDPALKLAVINIRNNMLEFLDENLFQNMPQLTFVNLESNNLVTVSEFKNKEIFVILSGNPLQCDCSIEWLQSAENLTDYYRLRCFSNGTSTLIKNVKWKKIDC